MMELGLKLSSVMSKNKVECRRLVWAMIWPSAGYLCCNSRAGCGCYPVAQRGRLEKGNQFQCAACLEAACGRGWGSARVGISSYIVCVFLFLSLGFTKPSLLPNKPTLYCFCEIGVFSGWWDKYLESMLKMSLFLLGIGMLLELRLAWCFGGCFVFCSHIYWGCASIACLPFNI